MKVLSWYYNVVVLCDMNWGKLPIWYPPPSIPCLPIEPPLTLELLDLLYRGIVIKPEDSYTKHPPIPQWGVSVILPRYQSHHWFLILWFLLCGPNPNSFEMGGWGAVSDTNYTETTLPQEVLGEEDCIWKCWRLLLRHDGKYCNYTCIWCGLWKRHWRC